MKKIDFITKRMSIHLQRLLMMMATIMMAFATLTACNTLEDNNDENGKEEEGGNGGGGGVSGKRVKSWVYSYTEPNIPARYELLYKNDGTLERIDAYDVSSKLIIRQIITLNSNGTINKIEATDIRAEGILIVENFTFDGNNKPLKMKGNSIYNGAIVASTNMDYTFQNGRKVKQLLSTAASEILVNTMEWTFSYDGNGRRTKTLSTPTTGIATEYTRTYNSDGTLQKVNYINGITQMTVTFTWENGKSTVNWDDHWSF